jgi:predicted kinase
MCVFLSRVQADMSLILVCGPMGAGKTHYSIEYARRHSAIRFSIDPWMQKLFAKDMIALDYAWMLDRVERCHFQIWEVASQILQTGGKVVLDLGFTTFSYRQKFRELAREIDILPELHFLRADEALRRKSVKQRNAEKDPLLYSFEVTDFMFNFMEQKFEPPSKEELVFGKVIVRKLAER